MTDSARSIIRSSSIDASSNLTGLRDQLRQFARERDWEQFHNPRSLLLALIGETGELAEIFQWLTDDAADAVMDDPRQASRVREELADVFAYLLRLADVLDVDLAEALEAKIKDNARRYPVERAHGNARKYSELDQADSTVPAHGRP